MRGNVVRPALAIGEFAGKWGIVQLLIRLKELLIFNGLCAIIISPKIQNLTATFKMINKLGGDLYD